MQTEYKPSFERDLRRIRNAKLRQRIERKIMELKAADAITEVSSVRHLSSQSGNDYRIRIGVYRLGVTVVNDVAILDSVGHRSEFYRRFP